MKDLAVIRSENGPATCAGYPDVPCMMWCAKHQVYHTHLYQDIPHEKPLFRGSDRNPGSTP